jgi:hypothetical protein
MVHGQLITLGGDGSGTDACHLTFLSASEASLEFGSTIS